MNLIQQGDIIINLDHVQEIQITETEVKFEYGYDHEDVEIVRSFRKTEALTSFLKNNAIDFRIPTEPTK